MPSLRPDVVLPDRLSAPPSAAVAGTHGAAAPPRWRDYLTLTKPEISFLVMISALAGFLLGSPGPLDGVALAATLAGTVLTAAGVGALNHVLERHLDAQMRRTADRPLPAGRVSARAATAYGSLLVMAGIGLLCPLTNVLTAVLGILTVVLYLYVYTPLKRKTKYNTLVGTIPGALPALGGWTAATNTLDWGGWALFAILLVWQMPHFLALAWMYRKDYARARYAMLPVVEPDGASTVGQTFFFSVLLAFLGLAPVAAGVAGVLYGVGAALLGAWFLVPAWAFLRSRTAYDARRVLKASIVYIPALVALIVLERLLA